MYTEQKMLIPSVSLTFIPLKFIPLSIKKFCLKFELIPKIAGMKI